MLLSISFFLSFFFIPLSFFHNLFYSLNFLEIWISILSKDHSHLPFVFSLNSSTCFFFSFLFSFPFSSPILFSFLFFFLLYSLFFIFLFSKKKRLWRKPDEWNNSNRIWISFPITIFVLFFFFSFLSLLFFSLLFTWNWFQKKSSEVGLEWNHSNRIRSTHKPNLFVFVFFLFSFFLSFVDCYLSFLSFKRVFDENSLIGRIPTEIFQLSRLITLYFFFSFSFSFSFSPFLHLILFFISFFLFLFLFFQIWKLQPIKWGNSLWNWETFPITILVFDFTLDSFFPFFLSLLFLVFSFLFLSLLLFREFSVNFLKGSIPSEIGKLNQLYHLYLLFFSWFFSHSLFLFHFSFSGDWKKIYLVVPSLLKLENFLN